VAAVYAGFRPENVHGFDVDAVALQIARTRLAQMTERESTALDLRCQDFLKFESEQQFDVVFTNPPWGKKLPKAMKDQLARGFGTGKSDDTSSLFIAATLSKLKPNGYMGMLLPDSFFNVAVFEDIRRFIAEQKILEFKDYGKPFEGLVTKAKSVVLQKTRSNGENTIVCCDANGEHHRRQDSFTTIPKTRFNFATTQREAELINRLFNHPHVTLHENAKWGIGIVTGNNKKHVHATCGEDMIPVWKGSDIQRDNLAAPTNFISTDFSRYQQVAKSELFRAARKLIYKFISSELVFFFDDQQRFVLNSANFVIPDDDFPLPCDMLAKYFSCRFVNWVFASLFETHKVLRADLEYVPIFHKFLRGKNEFNEADLLNYLNIESTDGSYRTKT